MIADRGNHGAEVVRLAKGAALNRFKDLVEASVDGVRPIGVRMAQVFDIFGEGAEKEYVFLANLAGNLDL